MTVIDYYFTTISPYCYLAGDKLERIAARHGARIAYKPVDMMKVFEVTGGVPVKARHQSRQEYRFQDMGRRARREGVAMNLQPKFWPGAPMLSCCALIAAEAAVKDGRADGDVGKAARAMLRAQWAEQKDIGDTGVIAAALDEAGFSADVLADGVGAGATYASNTAEAVQRGVFGAPFYIVGDQRFWGQDRLDDLELLLKELAAGKGGPNARH
ncbi:MAG: 2-hydroxychromene-2-carboxylate isomerase [Paracoccaceae bacterium]|jgi:2-hydroxychromene-2-carboxylate isomerase